MSVNKKGIIRMHLGCNWLITQKTTNQCFFCEQQAMDLGNLHFFDTKIYCFNIFSGDIYLSS